MLEGFEGAWRVKPGHATPVPRLYFASATDSMAGSSPNTIAVAFSLRQTFPPALHRAQEAVRVLVRMRRLEPIEQLAAGAHGSASNHACNCSVTLTNGSGRRRSRLTFRPGRPQAGEELLERRHRRVLRFRDRLVGDVHDALLMHPHLPKQPDRIERRRQFGAGSGRISGEAMRVLILIVAEHPGAGACRVVQAPVCPGWGRDCR